MSRRRRRGLRFRDGQGDSRRPRAVDKSSVRVPLVAVSLRISRRRNSRLVGLPNDESATGGGVCDE